MQVNKTIFSCNYNIHSQPEWFDSYKKNFQIESKDVIDLGMDNLPFQFEIRNKRRFRFIKEKHLYPLGHGPNDFVLIPLIQNDPLELAENCVDQLLKIKNKWDHFHLYYVPESSNGWKELKAAFEKSGFRAEIRRHRHFYRIDTTSNWDDYYNDFLHKSLRDVRGRFNRLKKANLSYTVHETLNDISKHLDSLLEIYDQRRQSTGQKNAFAREAHRKMLEQVIKCYEKKGWVKLSYLLGSDDKIWAYQLDFIKDGIQYHYTPAFDEEYKFYSPSKILLYETLKKAFQDKSIREFNFMRGESPYKTQYARQKEDYIFIDVINMYSATNKKMYFLKKLSRLKNKLFSN